MHSRAFFRVFPSGKIVSAIALSLVLFGSSSFAASVSANGTTIPSASKIIDSSHNVWTISKGVVYENKKAAGYSANVVKLIYQNSVIYQENASDGFWFWNGNTWVSSSNPLLSPSASGTVIPSAAQIVDSGLNVWSVSNGVVYENNKAAGYSANVIKLIYQNSVIYQENAAQGFWSWNGSTWVSSSNPLVSSRGPASTSSPSPTPTPPPTATVAPTNSISVRQTANNVVTGGNFLTSLSASFTEPNEQGSAIWVVVSAPSKDAPGGNAWKFNVTDTQGNKYVQLGNNQNDGSPGNQSVAQFLATGVKGGSGNKVSFTMSYSGGAGNDNYLGIFAAEVTGVDQAYDYSGNINDNPEVTSSNKGANLISAGSLSAAPGPMFVMALSLNTDGGGSDEGGSGDPAPTAGSGLSQQGSTMWEMDGSTPLAIFATGTLTPSGGAVNAYFNAQAASSTGTNDYATVAVGFYASSSATAPNEPITPVTVASPAPTAAQSGNGGCEDNAVVMAYNNGAEYGWGDFDNSASTNYQDTSGAAPSGSYDAKTTINGAYGEWLYHAPCSNSSCMPGNGIPQYGVNITGCNFMYISLKQGASAPNWTIYAVLDYPADAPTGVSAINVSDLAATSQGNGWVQYKVPLYPSINGKTYSDYFFTGPSQTALPAGGNTFYKFAVQDHSGESSNYWYGADVYFSAE